MKIQELAIIFVIIILPISIILSEYTQFQIQTINLQTTYDAKLTSATYDAIKAFQLNSSNSSTSDMANSKLRDIEASVETFRNSIMTAFELNGYKEDELNNYIPALVYTLYDGFYIYSPYENTHDETGNRITGGGDSIYGLKPYINYSCRYVKGNMDVVITYALDNYITVQGMINGIFVNKSGYLIDGITYNQSTDKVIYSGIEIQDEQLKENLLGKDCNYAKINGTKYYLVRDYLEGGKDCIVFVLNGKLIVQYDEDDEEFKHWKYIILNNESAKQYYKNAYEFTKWLRNETDLDTLRYSDARDEVISNDGTTTFTNVWSGNDTLIFGNVSGTNIENELSNFNQHRLAVIRHKIETNLAIAISNYNNYSKHSTNVFQMPELKEDEWDSITHNISLISFLQGIHIGGKIYNGYTLVTNSESKEVVTEDSIYILAQNADGRKAYHKIGDKGFEDNTLGVNAGEYGEAKSAGRLSLDFEKSSINKDASSYFYYPLDGYKASYDSIIMQNNVTTYDDIYAYVNEQDVALKQAFYQALGRERVSKYKNSNSVNKITDINIITHTIQYDLAGGQGGPVPTVDTIMRGETYTISMQEPTRMGYSFMGWGAGTKTYLPGESFIVREDLVLKAKWGAHQYTIIYDANKGTGAPANQRCYYGETTNLSSVIPTRTGYRFKGWSTILNSATPEYQPGDAFIRTGQVLGDVKLYAVWEEINYTIAFNANGGEGGPTSGKKQHGFDFEIPQTKPTKIGYNFLGWSESSTATTATYSAGGKYTKDANVTLYAVWKINKYRISYDANGGSGGPTFTEVEYNKNTLLSTNKPTKTGYTFLGWSTSKSATTQEYNAGGTYPKTGGVTSDVTLYAVWKISTYTISYDANGGEGAPGSQQATYGQKIRLSSTTPKRHWASIWGVDIGYYEFQYWQGNDGKIYYPGEEILVTRNLTLKAVWSSLKFW